MDQTETVKDGHFDIGNNQIRIFLFQLAQGIITVPRHRGDGEVIGLPVDEFWQPRSDTGFIIDNHNLVHSYPSTGIIRLIVVPSFSRLSITKLKSVPK